MGRQDAWAASNSRNSNSTIKCALLRPLLFRIRYAEITLLFYWTWRTLFLFQFIQNNPLPTLRETFQSFDTALKTSLIKTQSPNDETVHTPRQDLEVLQASISSWSNTTCDFFLRVVQNLPLMPCCLICSC